MKHRLQQHPEETLDPPATHYAGHEQMFRSKLWVSLVLFVPVLIYSEMIQFWLGYSALAFPVSMWISPISATVVFVYGGWPFIDMAIPDVLNRKPGMMALIFLAISVKAGR